MINVNEEYVVACDSSERQSYIIARYGKYDKETKRKIKFVSSSEKAKFSNLTKLYNDIKETNYNYITCEPQRVILDNTFHFILDKNSINANESIAYWSNNISNNQNQINASLVLEFTGEISLNDIILYFQEVCTRINVRFFNNNNEIYSDNIYNDGDIKILISIPENQKSLKYNKIIIDFLETKFPNRYIKLNEIDFGSYQTFTNKEIKDINIIDELSIDSSELSSNYLSLTLNDNDGMYNILNPENKLSSFEEKQEITIYHYLKVKNKFKEIPLGTFLLKEFRVGKGYVTIEAYDDVYFMNKLYYGSNFYNNTPIKNVLLDLFTYFDYSNYIIDDELENVYLTGYVPIVEFREALRLIAEAGCCVISKTRYGKTYIFKTYDPIAKSFEGYRSFQENHTRNLFNDVIEINENSYLETLNEEVYRSKLKKGKYTIIYDKYPILPKTLIPVVENGKQQYEILNQNATSCDIEVYQETEVVLNATLMKRSTNGKKYFKNSNVEIEYDEYSISEVYNTLITSFNSEEVALWKLGRGDIKYNFTTLVTPYIEVGDTCEYRSFQPRPFIVTRIEFDKTLKEKIEGE